MIDRSVFAREWRVLCKRFGREQPGMVTRRYYDSLSPCLTTPEFVDACRSIFMRSEFFPRPSEFFVALSHADWGHVVDAISAYHGPEWAWAEPYHRISERGRRACERLGGIPGMKAMYEASPGRLQERWYREVESQGVVEAQERRLGSGDSDVGLPEPLTEGEER